MTIAANPITLEDLCVEFLASKKSLLDAGEIGPRQYRDYVDTFNRMKKVIDPNLSVAELTVRHFMTLRTSTTATRGPTATGNEIQRCRTLFKFAYECGFIDSPIRFGPDFRKPPRRLVRRAKREKGLQMFEANEIKRLILRANPAVAAMIYLGINCGFGNTDVGRLPMHALDLTRGWVTFPRPKTEIDRRCPLWGETVEAIKLHLRYRPDARHSKNDGLVFLTQRGNPWVNDSPSNPLSHEMSRLMDAIGVERRYLNFYGLRRAFETIGGESLDQPAVNHIMGHAPDSKDMASVYRQRISDDRLVKVTGHVATWLLGRLEKPAVLRQSVATVIHAEWAHSKRINAADVRLAVSRLSLQPCELATMAGISRRYAYNICHSQKETIGLKAENGIRNAIASLAKGDQKGGAI